MRHDLNLSMSHATQIKNLVCHMQQRSKFYYVTCDTDQNLSMSHATQIKIFVRHMRRTSKSVQNLCNTLEHEKTFLACYIKSTILSA